MALCAISAVIALGAILISEIFVRRTGAAAVVERIPRLS
jgi:hypothetical protein